MQHVTSMRSFQIIILLAITFTVFGNNAVLADNSDSKSLKSPEKTKQPLLTSQRIAAIPLKIPDNFPLGIVSTIRLDDFALLKTVNVEVHIAHPHIGDLLVQLECPNGRIVTLNNHDGGRKKNLDAVYRVTECNNSQAAGNWKLRISDNAPTAMGSLLSWKLRTTSDKTDEPLFRISGVKDWYLIGNAMTPGNNSLDVRVDVSGKVESVAAVIDEGHRQQLTKTVAGFAGAIDITQLPTGVHTISLTANGSQSPFAKLEFRRSHPLYALLTTDWDSSDSRDSILTLHEELHRGHPGLKITHFFGPYTFTDPAVSSLRRAYLANWLLRLRATYQDEIGLHIHPFCNFVDTVPGVPCRFKPSDSYDKGDTTGYTVLSSAYSKSEFLKLLQAADALFTAHGLGKPSAFRTGSWAANADVLKALAADGFVADSSANNWAKIEESRDSGNGVLYRWNREHWRSINDISQPYYPNTLNPATAAKPAIPILEIPDNGSMVDYVTGDEMIEIFNANWFGMPLLRPTTFVFGFHPVSYSQGFHMRMEKALAHIDGFLAANGEGPVVYETLSRISHVFEDLSRSRPSIAVSYFPVLTAPSAQSRKSRFPSRPVNSRWIK
ncbi:MAG: proprotein convertase P-domain-containing protein [Methylobacter sp.]|nr:proprotein convertase P-domain-containing protein [Methylobacter sp.]